MLLMLMLTLVLWIVFDQMLQAVTDRLAPERLFFIHGVLNVPVEIMRWRAAFS